MILTEIKKTDKSNQNPLLIDVDEEVELDLLSVKNEF